MNHLEPIRRRVQNAVVSQAPAPWRDIGTWAIGGLTELGFGRGNDLLLIVSSQGRGVIDTRLGTKAARDPEPPSDAWYDEFRLVARGIGPLADEEIALAGLHGGGLANATADGWWIERIALPWPHEHLLLGGGHGSVHDNATAFVKLGVEPDVRAFGFSGTGKTLVLATASDVRIFSRA